MSIDSDPFEGVRHSKNMAPPLTRRLCLVALTWSLVLAVLTRFTWGSLITLVLCGAAYAAARDGR